MKGCGIERQRREERQGAGKGRREEKERERNFPGSQHDKVATLVIIATSRLTDE
jgi:hypothetical protein